MNELILTRLEAVLEASTARLARWNELHPRILAHDLTAVDEALELSREQDEAMDRAGTSGKIRRH